MAILTSKQHIERLRASITGLLKALDAVDVSISMEEFLTIRDAVAQAQRVLQH